MDKATLYLIPNTLGDSAFSAVIPTHVSDIINTIDDYIVEDEKAARQLLKKAGIKKPLPEIRLSVLNEHTHLNELPSLMEPLLKGRSIGIISDAGCAAIADPGAEIVKLAQEKNIRVIPLVGPNSILLALMASGLNGQNFAFHGYIPRDKNERDAKIKELSKNVLKNKTSQGPQTQLFIEAPYRNNQLIDDLIRLCEPQQKICIACDITLPTEFIKTLTAKQWAQKKPDIHKRPAIFAIGI